MEENNKNTNTQEDENAVRDNKQEMDNNLKEIINKAKKAKPLTSTEIKILEEQAKESLEFLKLIDKISLPNEKYVIYCDGEEELVYENGEFFIQSTLDSTRQKKKKKRNEARDLYIEYFIRYQLSPIKKQMDAKKKINTIQVEDVEKEVDIQEKSKKVKEEKKKEKIKKEEKSKEQSKKQKEILEQQVEKPKAKANDKDEYVR